MAKKRIIREDELNELVEKPAFMSLLYGTIPGHPRTVCPYCMTDHSGLETCGATATAVYVGRDCELQIDYYLDED